MSTKAALMACIGTIMLTAPLDAEPATRVQITGTEVQNYCYFDSQPYSPGASICDPLYAGRVLTCQPKSDNPLRVARWFAADDPRCTRK